MSTIKAANIQNPSAASAAIVLDTSGNFSVPAGTVSAPGIQAPSDSNTGIFFPAADTIAFAEGGTEAMRIDSSSRLLVGTSTARSTGSFGGGTQQLEQSTYSALQMFSNGTASANFGSHIGLWRSRGNAVGGTTIVNNGDLFGAITFGGYDGTNAIEGAAIRAEVDGTPGANDMPGRLVFATTADNASSPTTRFTIFRDGSTEISGNYRPTADNSYNLGGAGQRWATVYAANGTINTSDGREKTDIKDSPLGADFIKSLRPVSYKWIEGGKRELPERDEHGNIVYETLPGQRTHWGFIAQEVKEVVDETGVDFGGWILTDKDDPDSQQGLRYHEFIAPLTKALQEALAEIDVLKAKVAALESA